MYRLRVLRENFEQVTMAFCYNPPRELRRASTILEHMRELYPSLAASSHSSRKTEGGARYIDVSKRRACNLFSVLYI